LTWRQGIGGPSRGRSRIPLGEDRVGDIRRFVAALTAWEMDVLALMAEGRSNNGIAKALHLSEAIAALSYRQT